MYLLIVILFNNLNMFIFQKMHCINHTQISFPDPPNIPVITGYQSGQPVQARHTVRMICESMGGNPAPQVVWFKNNMKLDYSFSIGHGKSTNELSFPAQPLDNGAVYRCEASNQATQLPLTTQVKLAVHCKCLVQVQFMAFCY